MKRKTTDLEKNLIKKGFQLIQKNYAGKHSEKTLNYIYKGRYVPYRMLDEINVVVVLNAKRDKILDIRIAEPLKILGVDYINFKSAKLLGLYCDEITEFVYDLKQETTNADETVEIVEEIENETQGTETD